MRKLLFLDFDGVLTSGNDESRRIVGNLPRKDSFGQLFDEDAVRQLEAIVNATQTDIIVCSTWKEYGQDFLREMWEKRKMPGKVTSVTPTLLSTTYINTQTGETLYLPERAAKGLEINAWIEEYGKPDDSYCILDDENNILLCQQEYLVQTDGTCGLTEKEANKVITILNGTR